MASLSWIEAHNDISMRYFEPLQAWYNKHQQNLTLITTAESRAQHILQPDHKQARRLLQD